ncbi:uncharacterized protein LOC105284476 isoform X2 [Ooceraea biroi]|uniref:uncharacterized protein LOC105284476 isoform X2 n=1 Tax=Ooceraea biroi TaxID=2015173 RepID=UPI0005BAAAB9|nr:uncharacterized protein LOC105284476 isoform X2 [Ooceraea biroi]
MTEHRVVPASGQVAVYSVVDGILRITDDREVHQEVILAIARDIQTRVDHDETGIDRIPLRKLRRREITDRSVLKRKRYLWIKTNNPKHSKWTDILHTSERVKSIRS